MGHKHIMVDWGIAHSTYQPRNHCSRNVTAFNLQAIKLRSYLSRTMQNPLRIPTRDLHISNIKGYEHILMDRQNLVTIPTTDPYIKITNTMVRALERNI